VVPNEDQRMIAPDSVTAERVRKLEALAARPGTPGEGVAARAAIERIMARLRPTIIEPRARPPAPTTIVGLYLKLDRTCDRRKPCCDRRGMICEGVGPHGHALRCARCRKHRGWLRKAAGDVLRAMQKNGRLSAEPVLRDAGIIP
jgi:hypothetical protein